MTTETTIGRLPWQPRPKQGILQLVEPDAAARVEDAPHLALAPIQASGGADIQAVNKRTSRQAEMGLSGLS